MAIETEMFRLFFYAMKGVNLMVKVKPLAFH